MFRTAPMGGVCALDLPAAIQIAGLNGYDAAVVAALLSAAEPAIVEQINTKQEDEHAACP